jgi:transcriptional regulator with XRE-family HTH domain
MGTTPVARRRFELMAAEYLERLGNRLREKREELGLSRPEVARRMPGKTTENQVYRWEKGLHRPHDDALEALAGILGESVGYFLAAAPDKTQTPDLMATVTGADDDRLARIEEKLEAAEAQREDLAAQIAEQNANLARQSEILEDLKALVVALGVADGTTLQDRVVQLVRDAAARAASER